MAESDNHEVNPVCHDTEDVRNWTDTQIAGEMLQTAYSTLEKVFIPLIFAIGFVGNVTFLLILGRVKRMRTVTNFYLANLAAADLIVLSIELVVRILRYVNFNQVKSHPFYTDFGCGMFIFVAHLPTLSSISLITCVTFDRYFAICHPLKYRNTRIKKKISVILVILLWVISLVFSLCSVLAYGRLEYICIRWPPSEKYNNLPGIVRLCNPIHPFFQKDILEQVIHSIPYVAALIPNTFITISIVHRLTVPPPGENGNNQNERKKRRITWMLVANSVIFFACLAPYNILLVFGKVMNLSYRQQRYSEYTAFILVVLNSAINPILYGVVSPSYRRGFIKAFGLGNQIEPSEHAEQFETGGTTS